MKNKILLKTLLVLALIVAFYSFVRASDITTSNFSPDGTAFGPGVNNLALEDNTQTPIAVSTIKSSNLATTAINGFNDLSTSSSFWIVFLLLILFAFFVYLYRRSFKNGKTAIRV